MFKINYPQGDFTFFSSTSISSSFSSSSQPLIYYKHFLSISFMHSVAAEIRHKFSLYSLFITGCTRTSISMSISVFLVLLCCFPLNNKKRKQVKQETCFLIFLTKRPIFLLSFSCPYFCKKETTKQSPAQKTRNKIIMRLY